MLAFKIFARAGGALPAAPLVLCSGSWWRFFLCGVLGGACVRGKGEREWWLCTEECVRGGVFGEHGENLCKALLNLPFLEVQGDFC